MGYNPYICIICGVIEDNGWGWTIPFYQRVDTIIERLGEEKCRYYNKQDYIKNGYCSKVITCDVCDKCFKKGKPKIDEFFNNRHTKEERRNYWIKHNKKIFRKNEI